jgi:hypothetical protein
MPMPLSELRPRTLSSVAQAYRTAVSGPRSSNGYLDILGIHGQDMIKVAGFSDEEKNSLTLTTLLLANNQINATSFTRPLSSRMPLKTAPIVAQLECQATTSAVNSCSAR